MGTRQRSRPTVPFAADPWEQKGRRDKGSGRFKKKDAADTINAAVSAADGADTDLNDYKAALGPGGHRQGGDVPKLQGAVRSFKGKIGEIQKQINKLGAENKGSYEKDWLKNYSRSEMEDLDMSYADAVEDVRKYLTSTKVTLKQAKGKQGAELDKDINWVALELAELRGGAAVLENGARTPGTKKKG